jgi:hypothetical protein
MTALSLERQALRQLDSCRHQQIRNQTRAQTVSN